MIRLILWFSLTAIGPYLYITGAETRNLGILALIIFGSGTLSALVTAVVIEYLRPIRLFDNWLGEVVREAIAYPLFTLGAIIGLPASLAFGVLLGWLITMVNF